MSAVNIAAASSETGIQLLVLMDCMVKPHCHPDNWTETKVDNYNPNNIHDAKVKA